MWLSYVHLTAKWHLIIFRYEDIIDILEWPLCDFRMLKNVCTETLQNSVTETTQCTLRLMFDSHFVHWNCSLPAIAHLFKSWCEPFNSLVDWFLWHYRLSHHLKASLSSTIGLVFGRSLWYHKPLTSHHRQGRVYGGGDRGGRPPLRRCPLCKNVTKIWQRKMHERVLWSIFKPRLILHH